MSKYLVTGAPGWLGNRLLMALSGTIPELEHLAPEKEVDEIRCLVQPGGNPLTVERIHPKIKAYPGDIRDWSSLNEFYRDSEGAVLFHLAGIIHPSRKTKELFEINVQGAKNILEAAIRSRVKRFVVISSNSPAGTNPHKDHLFTEDTPYNPYMLYGRSKMEMEILVDNAFRRGDIETVILRPCWFYGPGQPLRQTLFFSMIKNGSAPIVGGGECKRSMSYVDNTCQALLLAAGNPQANGQLFWIADQRAYTMNEIVDTVEALLEKEFGFKVAHKRLFGRVACRWVPAKTGDIPSKNSCVVRNESDYRLFGRKG
jgi:nucleoside-diphosphate-sugar epimerase